MHQLSECSELFMVSHLHEGGLNLVDEVKEKKKMETPPSHIWSKGGGGTGK